MSVTRLLSVCPDIQAALDQVWADKAYPMQSYAHLQMLLSQANARQIKQQITPGSSKIKQVEVTWFQRGNGEGVTGQSQPVCVATERYGDNVKSYTIANDDTKGTGGEIIDIRDLDLYCQDNGAYFLARLRWHLEWLDRLVAQKTAQEAALQVGKYRSTVGPVDANDFLEIYTQLANGNPNPTAIHQIKTAARKTGYGTAPVVFADDLYTYAEFNNLTGCCAESGNDLGRAINAMGIAVLYDDFVSQAMGGSSFSYMTELGASQLLTHSTAQRLDGTILRQLPAHSNYVTIQLLTPAGLPADVTISDDCGKISIIPTVTSKLITLPEELFATGDEYEGVNYTNGISIVLPPCATDCYPPAG
jgi:hypothetical protein